ncbi:MAG: hypothetical protein BWY98_00465 [Tenericutes bacterium ADurb.BinA155]|jgi:hypothetical protein|nr:MAG: hypothetical protein BWY98_00465 [Tenericutes bacterium ADurb.BinA155]
MTNEKQAIIDDLNAKIVLGMKDRAFDVLVESYRKGIFNAAEYLSFRERIDRIKD